MSNQKHTRSRSNIRDIRQDNRMTAYGGKSRQKRRVLNPVLNLEVNLPWRQIRHANRLKSIDNLFIHPLQWQNISADNTVQKKIKKIPSQHTCVTINVPGRRLPSPWRTSAGHLCHTVPPAGKWHLASIQSGEECGSSPYAVEVHLHRHHHLQNK